MSECQLCRHWLTKSTLVYEDKEIVDFVSKEGTGDCQVLHIDTRATFGCNKFEAGEDSDRSRRIEMKGKAWQHWHMGGCPDCDGRGSGKTGGVCRRCAGTGQVRYYDDGHVGEEQTRRHPNEPEIVPAVDPGTVLAPQPKADVL